MPFILNDATFRPTVGKPVTLYRGHIDLAILALTFHYREWVHDGQQWNWEQRQQALSLHAHFRIDQRRGVIELLDDPFWHSIGRWAAGDRDEEMLYKGQVKHDRGQRIEFTYEHYMPEQVDDPASVDLDEIDAVASARLGYDVLKYFPIPKQKPPVDGWNWEEEVGPV